MSNFSSQAGPVVSSNDRWVSSNSTTTSSKYSHGMEQDTVGSRAIWIVWVWHIQILSDIHLPSDKNCGENEILGVSVHPNIHIFNLHLFGLLFYILRRIAFLSQENHSNLSRPLSEPQQTQLDVPRSIHKVTMTTNLLSCRPIHNLQS